MRLDGQEQLALRLRQAAERADKLSCPITARFLSGAERSLAIHAAREAGVDVAFDGGWPEAERVQPCFYPADEEPLFTGVWMEARWNAKFASVDHRALLGSLMALGMEREMLGDIVVQEDCAFLFCHNRIADYVCRNLIQVKHTSIFCEITDTPPAEALFRTERKVVQLSSERVDALIAHVFKMSRGDAQALFPMGKVFVDGRQCLSPGYTPKAGQVISVRGFGRMKYTGVESLSKKGKCNTVVELYI